MKKIVGINSERKVAYITTKKQKELLAKGKCPFCKLDSGWIPSLINAYNRRRHQNEVWFDAVGYWCSRCKTFFPQLSDDE
jgi:predicted ribosome-associated RNA-binding protein Tma20